MGQKELPAGWIKATIGNVSVKGGQRKPEPDEDFIYVDIGSIDRDRKRISSPQYLKGVNAPSRARKEISEGDILVSLTRPNLNAVALVDEKYTGQIASTGFEVIRPAGVEPRFIFAITRSRDFINHISGQVQGALYPAAKSTDVKTYEFPLPPREEQTRIANKLDELLAQVDTIKARVDVIPGILKRFRQSVLAAAVSGRLTEEWRGRSETNWCDKTIGDLLLSLDQGWSPKCENKPADSESWGVIKTSAIQAGHFLPEENKMLPELLAPRSRLGIKSGDILITRAGPRVRCGVTCMADKDFPQLMICDKVYRLRVNKNLVLPGYLTLVLNSPFHLPLIEKMKTGSSDSGMNLTQAKFKGLEFSLPPVDEQSEILRKVRSLMNFLNPLETALVAADTRITPLVQSILAKAFRGELVPQNPDDEPASVLLERIRVERKLDLKRGCR